MSSQATESRDSRTKMTSRATESRTHCASGKGAKTSTLMGKLPSAVASDGQSFYDRELERDRYWERESEEMELLSIEKDSSAQRAVERRAAKLTGIRKRMSWMLSLEMSEKIRWHFREHQKIVKRCASNLSRAA